MKSTAIPSPRPSFPLSNNPSLDTGRPSATNGTNPMARVPCVAPAPTPNSEWLTPVQAAERINVAVEFIYDACATAGLPHTRLNGRRHIRIRAAKLDEWMLAFEVEN